MDGCILESLAANIGRTVTIFTTSGGVSGCGFTGVLAGIGECSVRLITDFGAPPACPIGSACCGGFCGCGGNLTGYGYGGYGYGGGYGGGCGGSCGCGCGGGYGSGYGSGYGGGYGSGYGSGFGGGCGGGCGDSCGSGFGFGGYNWLGSITEIPLDRIAGFTHNAI